MEDKEKEIMFIIPDLKKQFLVYEFLFSLVKICNYSDYMYNLEREHPTFITMEVSYQKYTFDDSIMDLELKKE